MLTTERHGDSLPGLEDTSAAGTTDDGAVGHEVSSTRPRWSPPVFRPAAAMLAGVAVMAVAATVLVHQSPGGDRQAAALTIGGPGDVTVQLATYESGQSSGWHSHTGMHALVVLAGTLTIYDDGCQPKTFGPGDMYVGGHNAHLARNESPSPVEMTVTYLFPAGRPHTEFHVPSPAPAGCEVG